MHTVRHVARSIYGAGASRALLSPSNAPVSRSQRVVDSISRSVAPPSCFTRGSTRELTTSPLRAFESSRVSRSTPTAADELVESQSTSTASSSLPPSFPLYTPAPNPGHSQTPNIFSDEAPPDDQTTVEVNPGYAVWDSILPTVKLNTPSRAGPAERWEAYSAEQRRRMLESRPEAGKYSGRSALVNDFVPLQAAIGRVGRILNQNQVRKELRLVERYEKPTDKRRRLKSERHRRRFAEFVAQKVRVVREIKARGG